jgi:uncharacterized protein
MKLAIDSNVAVSSILNPDSVPGAVLGAWRQGHIAWVTCTQQFDELSVALMRPQLIAKISRGILPMQELLVQMHELCDWVDLTEPLPPICRDPRDDYLFALHDQGHIDMIVSGDKDVLALKPRYPVLTPRELIDRL